MVLPSEVTTKPLWPPRVTSEYLVRKSSTFGGPGPYKRTALYASDRFISNRSFDADGPALPRTIVIKSFVSKRLQFVSNV